MFFIPLFTIALEAAGAEIAAVTLATVGRCLLQSALYTAAGYGAEWVARQVANQHTNEEMARYNEEMFRQRLEQEALQEEGSSLLADYCTDVAYGTGKELILTAFPQLRLPVNVCTLVAKGVNFTLDEFSKSGQEADRKGLTRAGRALDKHGSRTPTVFPKATGNIASKNAQGQFQLDDILTHPNTQCIQGRLGDVKFYSPDGRGAHFRSDGTLKGFVERRYELQ